MSLLGNSKNFKIIIHKPGGKVTHTFSNKFQNFNFYYEEFYKTPPGDGRARSGKMLQKFKWVIYYYEIDWEPYSSDEDTKKANDVLNSEAQGYPIEIVPSLDIPSHTDFIVQIKQNGSAGKKMLTQWLREAGSEGSKGLKLTYTSVNPHPDISWPDPNDVTGYLVPGGEEYFI